MKSFHKINQILLKKKKDLTQKDYIHMHIAKICHRVFKVHYFWKSQIQVFKQEFMRRNISLNTQINHWLEVVNSASLITFLEMLIHIGIVIQAMSKVCSKEVETINNPNQIWSVSIQNIFVRKMETFRIMLANLVSHT